VFQISNQSKFEFPGEGRIADQESHSNIAPDGTLTILERISK